MTEQKLLWGAAAIGRLISRTPRQAAYLLERGVIQCAQKKGGQWVAVEGQLREEFNLKQGIHNPLVVMASLPLSMV
jgi:hypothetical protein